MYPVQSIALIVLTLAGIWAVVEIALAMRRARGAAKALDKTIDQLNDTISEARPVVAKLDGAIDELQPSLSQVEPLLKKANVAIEALSADLIEVNGVIRDVSQLTGGVASASEAVTSITDAASDKVQRLFGRRPKAAPAAERSLTEPAADGADVEVPVPAQPQSEQTYYTYGEKPAGAASEGESVHE